jgi:hypothetical protein
MTFRETPTTPNRYAKPTNKKYPQRKSQIAQRKTANTQTNDPKPTTTLNRRPNPHGSARAGALRRMGLTALMSGFPNRIRWRSCLNRLVRADFGLNLSLLRMCVGGRCAKGLMPRQTTTSKNGDARRMIKYVKPNKTEPHWKSTSTQ